MSRHKVLVIGPILNEKELKETIDDHIRAIFFFLPSLKDSLEFNNFNLDSVLKIYVILIYK